MELPAGTVVPVVDLVRAAAAGERAAWDEIVTRYAPLVLSVTRRCRLAGEDGQDVAQTVWLRLVEHLGQLREPAALPGWLVSTTRHECLRVLAAARRTTPVDTGVLAESRDAAVDGGVDDRLLADERHTGVLSAVAALPSRHRELLLLLAADPPVAYRQIADRLGMPVGSIGPTRARALAALRSSPAVQALLDGAVASSSAPSSVVRGGGRHGVAGN